MWFCVPKNNFIFLQRPADSQSPEDESEGSGAQAPKRPALSGFSFRPSPLQKATQGLILRQSSLATCTPSSTGERSTYLQTQYICLRRSWPTYTLDTIGQECWNWVLLDISCSVKSAVHHF